ncbi:hypothetical protein FHW96_000248 [Novosphingobium sp. SG751A]|uniref:hypothetical protein n=1 Tax=Novosphingobium sp. SG751A TaxID=2587000 RepID=UPI001556DB84|nr:hypothetical protein [Novosphingobium sp. SG751A]NOW44121.1 hypothetical protein [Novosphingobium sp. SG751A]
MNWIKRKWAEVSTKAGTVIIAVAGYLAEVAPQYAGFDRRIAYAGIAAGAVLVAIREKVKTDGQ